ncbi:hypothetical protein [uncultured Aquitalea sp.]|uniref:hypothetical protein n=1 Tax=uncultured Aquitalea sp. TaxID=540272 RepID=UPI0025EE733F|nr:hypothetical protein [uncultured Aquitalea sp.]
MAAKPKTTPTTQAKIAAPQDNSEPISQQSGDQIADQAAQQKPLQQGPAEQDDQAQDVELPGEQEPSLPAKEQAAAALTGLFEPNAVEVVAKCESFRRAGRVFTRDKTTIRLEELNESEFKLLYEEPMLAVQLTYLSGEE